MARGPAVKIILADSERSELENARASAKDCSGRCGASRDRAIDRAEDIVDRHTVLLLDRLNRITSR